MVIRPCLADPQLLEWMRGDVGGEPSSCRDGATEVRWDARPLGDDAAGGLRAVMVRDAEGDTLLACDARWTLAILAEPSCQPDIARSLSTGCMFERRVTRPAPGAWQIALADGRFAGVSDEDLDGCPDRVHTRSSDHARETESFDDDADGHPEIVVVTVQHPCGLRSGPDGAGGGCLRTVSVRCDPDSDGTVDFSCSSHASGPDSSCSMASCPSGP